MKKVFLIVFVLLAVFLMSSVFLFGNSAAPAEPGTEASATDIESAAAPDEISSTPADEPVVTAQNAPASQSDPAAGLTEQSETEDNGFVPIEIEDEFVVDLGDGEGLAGVLG